MKNFLIRLLIYVIPLPLFLCCILIIDPFNYFDISHFITDGTKHNISRKLNPQLWKMLEYKHLRTNSIILGDSRSDLIDTEHIRQLSGKDVYNFSYGGGTLLDMIETFWYADGLTDLKEVYIGINFNLYNDFEKNNNVAQAKSISRNFFSYSFSKVVFKTALESIKKQYFVKDLQIGIPEMDFEGFWKYQLDVNAKRFYQKYLYPEDYFRMLKEISDYCDKNHINLILFIPPNHAEWQQRKFDFGLTQEHALFLKDMSELGKVYNFDIVNEFTSNKVNFRDPVHPVNDSLICHTIWDKYTSE
jgi:hypothetical protein